MATCTDPSPSLVQSHTTTTIFTLLYVGVLYLPFNTGDRDATSTILHRITTLTLLSFLLELYLSYNLPSLSTSTIPHHLHGFLIATFLTLLLYTGHLLTSSPPQLARGARAVRNYLAAPVLEELVFRRHALRLYACHSRSIGLLFPALLFALAHGHHAVRMGWCACVVQIGYTFLFGVYAAMLFVNTDTVMAPIAAHVVCNLLEVPDLEAVRRHPRRKWVVTIYIVAVLLFVGMFQPVTKWVASNEVLR